jgi:hypothetical protein
VILLLKKKAFEGAQFKVLMAQSDHTLLNPEKKHILKRVEEFRAFLQTTPYRIWQRKKKHTKLRIQDTN